MSTVSENLLLQARMLSAVLAHDRDIRNIDRRFFLHDAALDVALGICPRVALDHLNAFDHDLSVRGHDDQNSAGFASVFAAENVNLVVFLN